MSELVQDAEWFQGMMNKVREESDKAAETGRPNFVAVADRTSMAFINLETAKFWQSFMKVASGIDLTVVGLENYDWEENPANFKFHNISTKEGKQSLVEELNKPKRKKRSKKKK
jgi:hypothetical protein